MSEQPQKSENIFKQNFTLNLFFLHKKNYKLCVIKR